MPATLVHQSRQTAQDSYKCHVLRALENLLQTTAAILPLTTATSLPVDPALFTGQMAALGKEALSEDKRLKNSSVTAIQATI